jgi:membrane protein DedA with SNARE-associated domain
VTFNLLGGLVWAIGVMMLGYGLGKASGSVEGILRKRFARQAPEA